MEGTIVKNEYKLQIHVHIGNSNQIFFFKCAHYCVFYAVFIFAEKYLKNSIKSLQSNMLFQKFRQWKLDILNLLFFIALKVSFLFYILIDPNF